MPVYKPAMPSTLSNSSAQIPYIVSLDNSAVLAQPDKLSKGLLLAAPLATKPVCVEGYPFLSLLFEAYALVENPVGSPP
jgi:hypothetical protein